MRFLKIVGVILLVVVGCGVGAQLYFLYAHPLPAIAAGLPRFVHDAEKEFDRRIKERFPIGSSEKDLVIELNRQGFPAPIQCYSVARKPGDENCRYTTFSRASAIFIEEAVRVVWRTDGEGKLSEIVGAYGLTGL